MGPCHGHARPNGLGDRAGAEDLRRRRLRRVHRVALAHDERRIGRRRQHEFHHGRRRSGRTSLEASRASSVSQGSSAVRWVTCRIRASGSRPVDSYPGTNRSTSSGAGAIAGRTVPRKRKGFRQTCRAAAYPKVEVAGPVLSAGIHPTAPGGHFRHRVDQHRVAARSRRRTRPARPPDRNDRAVLRDPADPSPPAADNDREAIAARSAWQPCRDLGPQYIAAERRSPYSHPGLQSLQPFACWPGPCAAMMAGRRVAIVQAFRFARGRPPHEWM